ncbi:MAG TPA: hypothetical protein VG247_01750 [Pseudonocardiaceae bacterium]|jgi:hypothetical protein|nr:hypothetical protein [Pseudonocardiaceae bacterium]
MSWGRRSRLAPRRLVVASCAGLLLVAGCSDPVSGTARPAVTQPVAPQADDSTTQAPVAKQVAAACPLLPAAEVGAIYQIPVTSREAQPVAQTSGTLYNCLYLNGAKQQLAALQVVVDPMASGDPQRYLDGVIKPFLAQGAISQPVTGLDTPAASYVMSGSSGPLAFVVAAVRSVGSTWDVVQFLVSEHNAGDTAALAQMTAMLRSALSRL